MIAEPIIIVRSDGRDGQELFIKDADLRQGEKVYPISNTKADQIAMILATARYYRGER